MINYDQYQNTFRRIINYELLAETLSGLQLINKQSLFVDAPCGSGELLVEVKKIIPGNCIGIDLNPFQVKLAKEKLLTERIYQGDIFLIDKYLDHSSSKVIHCGFCLLNTFPIDHQLNLVRQYLNTPNARSVVFEIQNWKYFELFFPVGIDFQGTLSNGASFFSKTLVSSEIKKIVRFTFENMCSVDQELYNVNANTIQKIANERNFNFKLIDCKYRHFKDNCPSHFLIILEKL